MRALTSAVVASVLAALVMTAPAHATFPGANGKIAFVKSDPGSVLTYVATVNPDGTGYARLPGSDFDSAPAWSADGQKIAFARTVGPIGANEIWTMNADGSGQTRLTNNFVFDGQPSWSPNGTKIVFQSSRDGNLEIYTMNSDGSGQTRLTNNPTTDGNPDWSPDGASIVFDRVVAATCSEPFGCHPDVFVMNADGSQPVRLTTTVACSSATSAYDPEWSPSGNFITFTQTEDSTCEGSGGALVALMNPDGSNRRIVWGSSEFDPTWSPDETKLLWVGDNGFKAFDFFAGSPPQLTYATSGSDPDWQPIAVAIYPHPQSASQVSVSIIPAFKQCATGGNPSNAKHSPPLATDSCNPPRPGSVLAAVGVTSQGSAQMTVVPGDTDPTNGNQANVTIGASLTDIQAASGADYNPNPSGADLTAVTRLRFTDKDNGYGGLPATATEYDFKVPIDCSSTVNPSVGSDCSVSTTANALAPGLIQEQRQTIVQAFRVRVDDSGANGVRGDSDDRIFATQGVFVP